MMKSREDSKSDHDITLNLTTAGDSNLIFVNVNLPRVNHHRALVDSGAGVNDIHSRLAEHLPQQPIIPKILRSVDKEFLGTVTATTTFFWDEIGKEVTFHISDFDAQPIILGAPITRDWITLPPTLSMVTDDKLDNTDNSLQISTMETDSKHLEEEFFQELIDDQPTVHSMHIEPDRSFDIFNIQVDTNETINLEEPPILESPIKKSEQLLSNQNSIQTPSITKFVSDLKSEYQDIFNTDPLPLSNENQLPKHKIPLIDESKVAFRKPYKIPLKYEEPLSQQIQTYLEQGFIEESTSGFNSPVVMVPKSDETLRMCNDFRELNENMTWERFPLPNLEDMLNGLEDAKVFTNLDLKQGYHQILLEETDRHKTAFQTPSGTYHWKVMPFGLKNAPGHFQRVMTHIFQPNKNSFIKIYLDDLIIYSRSLKEHETHLRKVFEIMREHRLQLKPSKCNFFKKSIHFLGHIVSSKGVSPAEDKLKLIQDFALPQQPKAMRSFLGFMAFYRRFIFNYSKIVYPLNQFALKKEPMSPSIEAAFKTIKEKFLEADVLIPPKLNANYVITTDASDFAVGAIIERLNDDNHKLGTVAFFSKTLDKFQKRYAIREKEILAIILVLRRYEHIFIGHSITINTDHQSIKYIFTAKTPPSPRMMRWLEFLAGFDLTINYIKGSTNKADILSRDFVNQNNTNTTNPIEETLTISTISLNFHNTVLGENFFDRVKQAYGNDEKNNFIIFHTIST
ncbi:hypothetical protein G210_3391 [Candida maltosa Xu316]|uniref:RNA-directed DNA polymerase n=1 Tax=Candida maltosa (strain Xu316) TaxID=1245528 RepID=M3JU13_CANMX|nr:hypothetical protein G210_3391 [Candida maltosa Xu316]